MDAFVTAGAGFLLAVLWFDLMHDVQVRGHGDRDVPEPALASIAAYYRRVTTDARPMNRLIALVMLLTLIAIGVELPRDGMPAWAAAASLVLAATGILIAGLHTVPSAVRLGTRADTAPEQSTLARSIYRDHVICFVAIAALLVVQLAFA